MTFAILRRLGLAESEEKEEQTKKSNGGMFEPDNLKD
jgi:hypothetical protein